jgi:lysophospholipase L1-like esterase
MSRGNKRIKQYVKRNAWKIAGLAALSAATIALAILAIGGATLSTTAGKTPAITGTYTPKEIPPAVTIMGDSFTAGSAMDSGPISRWPSLLTRELGIRANNLAIGSVGYKAANDKGETITTQADAIPDDTDAIVFFGGRNDTEPKEAIQEAAASAYAAALRAVPANKIVAIGPTWPTPNPPRNILADRDAAKAAAELAGIRFVDPISEGWMVDMPELIGADKVHPTNEGHVYLKDKIAPLVAELLK